MTQALLTKSTGALASTLTIEQINQISIAFHVFPDDWEDAARAIRRIGAVPGDGIAATARGSCRVLLKRHDGHLGSLFLLLLCSPLLLLIAAAVKATSRGPVFFRQQRLGQYGQRLHVPEIPLDVLRQ